MTDQDRIVSEVVGRLGNLPGNAAPAGAPGGEDDFDTPEPIPDDFRPPEVIVPFQSRGETVEEKIGMEWDRGTAGVSGLSLPKQNVVAISNRTKSHHDQLGRAVLENRDLQPIEMILPWASNGVGDQYFLEIPQSGGGLFQVMQDIGVADDIKRVVQGSQIDHDYLWAIVYAARLAGLPGVRTNVMFEYKPERMASADPAYFEDVWYELGVLYDELRFAGALPDAVVNR